MELYLEAFTNDTGQILIAWQTPDSIVHIMTVGTPDAAGWQYWERDNRTGVPGAGVPIAALKQEASKDARLLLSIDGLGPPPFTANLLHAGDDHARKFYYAVEGNGPLGVPAIVLRAEGLEVTPFDVPTPGGGPIRPQVTLRFDVRRTHIDPRHQGAHSAGTQFAGLP